MGQPTVAILIVTYNAERYIERTLKSCLEQTYPHSRVVILDNASTDATVPKIEALRSNRVVLHQSASNLGPYAGLNYLLERVDATYIAIQDHDDLWLPKKIEQQVKYLERHPDFVACGTQAFYYHEQEGLLIRTNNFAINGYPDHTSLMFRQGPDRYNVSKSLPDEFFQAVILRRRGLIGCLPDALSIHRIRGDQGNLSSARNRWNVRGALEHLSNTHYRDFAGALSMLVASILPTKFIWWSRKHISYRGVAWISRQQFESQYHFSLQ